ncbi:MAG: NADPH-dependent glutamate synthase [Bacteroidales bacterium]|jgi:glutamate synthase (NADPH/NADH) small chain|nr:NADPH-dependent glutamate synthase [Bacteroidales bacterium]
MNEEYLKTERSQPWREELRKTVRNADRTGRARVVMPEQDAGLRVGNQQEVNLGLSSRQAMDEAARCLDCVEPTCIGGCPVSINIPKFIKHIEAGQFLDAAKTLKDTNALPAVCGRVCPQEVQCEASCFYTQKLKRPAVAIGNLERFAADYERQSGKISVPDVARPNGIKVAVVGSGPAGLAAAGDLAKYGYGVTVFEALHEIGGVLKYGIPEFRLPNIIVDVEIENLRKMGVQFETSFIVGKTCGFDTLRAEGYRAFFIGSGAGLPNFMNIPGENCIGVFSSNEYLTRVNLMGAARPECDTPVLRGRNVAVIGGGNTAMDSVRTAKRLGAERAMIIYRRSTDEMPARAEEIHHARQEGVEFMCLHNPVEYQANSKGRVCRMVVQKMALGEPDASGRRRPVAVEGSEFPVDVDVAVVSIGVSPNPLIASAMPSLEVTRWGTLAVDRETMQTSIPDLFAGGDIVRGGATGILAMGDGRRAAAGIHKYLMTV